MTTAAAAVAAVASVAVVDVVDVFAIVCLFFHLGFCCCVLLIFRELRIPFHSVQLRMHWSLLFGLSPVYCDGTRLPADILNSSEVENWKTRFAGYLFPLPRLWPFRNGRQCRTWPAPPIQIQSKKNPKRKEKKITITILIKTREIHYENNKNAEWRITFHFWWGKLHRFFQRWLIPRDNCQPGSLFFFESVSITRPIVHENKLLMWTMQTRNPTIGPWRQPSHRHVSP